MFIQFLIDHGIYIEYMDEFEKHCNVTLAQFLAATPLYEYILSAFEWEHTEQGAKFWIDVNNKWVS